MIPGPLIAKNFCGSILADCFVLTPHNNQLRHCQRNTHSSRIQPPVSGPASLQQGPDCSFLHMSTCEPGTAGSFAVVVGRQWPHTESPRGWRGALPTASSSVSRPAAEVFHPPRSPASALCCWHQQKSVHGSPSVWFTSHWKTVDHQPLASCPVAASLSLSHSVQSGSTTSQGMFQHATNSQQPGWMCERLSLRPHLTHREERKKTSLRSL